MAIRSTVKSIVVKEGSVLLIKYMDESGFIHYELPGGGQNQFEEMEIAAKREFYEETGYRIKINRFAAIAEEIFEDVDLRINYPNHVHRIHHIFQAELVSDEMEGDIVFDTNQVGCEWVLIDKISEVYLIPKQLKEHLSEILCLDSPIYLGTVFEESCLK